MAIGDLKLTNPAAILDRISNQTLDSSSIDVNLLKDAELSPNLSFRSEATPEVTLNLRGGLSVQAFNSPDDKDADGILLSEAAKTPEGALPSQLTLAGDRAWLKYRVEAGLKAKSGATLQSVGLDVDAGASAILSDYHVHHRNETVREALVRDLTSSWPRFATMLDHVKLLEPQDAVAMQVSGRLRTSVDVSWSDVMTGNIGALSRLAGTQGPIGIKLSAGASVTATVEVEDDFLIVFSRIDRNTWRAGVRRARSRGVGGSLAGTLAVSFANPKQVSGILDRVVEGVLGEPRAELNTLLAATHLDRLSAGQTKALSALVRKLGMKEPLATLDEVRKRVEEIEQKIESTITDIAKAKIALGFAYEYSRLSETVDLLEVRLDARRLDEHHKSLVTVKLEPVIAALQTGQPGLTLESYLNQKTLKRSQSWGFTLGIGKWVDIQGRDFKNVTTVVRRNMNGQLQESYLGVRGYRGKWIGETFEWKVDLKADMKAFSVSALPTVAEYEFGVHLLWTAEQKTLSKDELEQWLDMGVMWGVVREGDLAHAREILSPLVGEACDCSIQIAVPHDVFQAIRPTLAKASQLDFAGPLAAAMPWRKGNAGRTSVARRRQIYQDLWVRCLQEPDVLASKWAERAAAFLAKKQQSDLANLEKKFQTIPSFTFAGLVELNGNPAKPIASFTQGMNILDEAISSGAPNQKTIDKAFGKMDDLWTQSHHVRAFGVYLLDAAAAKGLLSDVARSLTVAPKEGDSILLAP